RIGTRVGTKHSGRCLAYAFLSLIFGFPPPTDINECAMQGVCQGGECLNTQGSFRCACKPGQVLGPSGDRNGACRLPRTPSARILLPLTDRRDVCWQLRGEDGMCSSPFGGQQLTYEECCCRHGKGWGYQCHACPPRSPGNGGRSRKTGTSPVLLADSSEEDSDECRCLNGRCVRTQQGSVCECPTGFQLDSTRTRCLDIDECQELNQRGRLCKTERCRGVSTTAWKVGGDTCGHP
uniref:TB domain-containing protein n=1 Tax=Pseudonaja textilis TaxID=8673 RepID=A0A670ZGZ6_PSETE